MKQWLYDTLGTVARVVPAVVGGYFGGPVGAMAGYELGATIVPTQQNKMNEVQHSTIGAYNPNAGIMRDPGNRVSTYYTEEIQPKDNWEKFGDISDTVNKSGMSIEGSGIFGGSSKAGFKMPSGASKGGADTSLGGGADNASGGGADVSMTNTNSNIPYGDMAKSLQGMYSSFNPQVKVPYLGVTPSTPINKPIGMQVNDGTPYNTKTMLNNTNDLSSPRMYATPMEEYSYPDYPSLGKSVLNDSDNLVTKIKGLSAGTVTSDDNDFKLPEQLSGLKDINLPQQVNNTPESMEMPLNQMQSINNNPNITNKDIPENYKQPLRYGKRDRFTDVFNNTDLIPRMTSSMLNKIPSIGAKQIPANINSNITRPQGFNSVMPKTNYVEPIQPIQQGDEIQQYGDWNSPYWQQKRAGEEKEYQSYISNMNNFSSVLDTLPINKIAKDSLKTQMQSTLVYLPSDLQQQYLKKVMNAEYIKNPYGFTLKGSNGKVYFINEKGSVLSDSLNR